jgi:hypothetical protein
MKSKITGGETVFLFKAHVLSKYEVSYFQCKDTGFIQTEEPYWLHEAYSSAITKLDIGIVLRNEKLIEVAEPLLLRYFDHNGLFLDYAGGYGLFTRMMRDRGFQFYHTDPYCQNIFAEYQDLKELDATTKFELVTAFEVLEHLTSPMEEIKNILSYSENFFFSTELIPPGVTKDWWYFSFETGQHVSFYTEASLRYIAKQFGRHYYTDGHWQHLFTTKQFSENPLLKIKKKEPFLIRKMRQLLQRYEAKINRIPPKTSLLDTDTKEAKKRISQ